MRLPMHVRVPSAGGRGDHVARPARRHLLALITLALLVMGVGVGLRDPWGVDEERFLGIALEMLQDGSWLVLHRAGEPYSDKPPLFMWLLALAAHITDAPRLAFRLPGLLAALGCTVCVYDLGRRLWSRPAGLAASLLFLATVQSALVLRGGQTDALLILWTTLGLYGLLRHLTAGPAWGWYVVASVAMGLGVMTKGVGFLPLFLLAPYVYGRWRGFRGLAPTVPQDPRWLIGPVVLLGTVALWLGPLLVRAVTAHDPALHAYLEDLLVTQTVRRMVAARQHREPVWYFVVQVIPGVWLPIVLGLPWLVHAWRRRLARGDGRLLLLLGWIALVLAFFSLSRGKRGLYIYPAVPALALAAGPMIAALVRRLGPASRVRRIVTIGAVAWFGGLIAWGLAEPFVGARHYPRRAIMTAVAHRVGAKQELGLVQWRDGQWLFARNPIVHFGYRVGPAQLGAALTWLRERPDRWLLGSDRALAACFDLARAVPAGRDRGRTLHLVDARADTGRCASEPISRLFRFRWARSVWAVRGSGESPVARLRSHDPNGACFDSGQLGFRWPRCPDCGAPGVRIDIRGARVTATLNCVRGPKIDGFLERSPAASPPETGRPELLRTAPRDKSTMDGFVPSDPPGA